MTGEWEGFCAMCASRDHCGDLQVYEVAGAAAVHVGELESVRLCTPCFAFVLETMTGAVHRSEHEPVDLHQPGRSAAECPARGCEVCHSTLDERPAFGIVLASNEPGLAPAPLARLRQQHVQHRVCANCLDWLRDVVDQESASRWANRRGADDPRGGMPVDVRYRVVSVGLSLEDEELLREIVAELGYRYVESAENLPTNSEVVRFVAASEDGLATAVANSLPITERVRTVVVSDAATLADAVEALRLGAADLLASPLSRQQISGQFDRLADPFAVSSRDEKTGLPSYWRRSRFGLSCWELDVTPAPGSGPLETFLVLRRFLRGYDRIGVRDDGTLPTMVYCSDDHIEGVVQRMRRLLGPATQITIAGRAPADGASTGGLDGANPRPALSRAFFGKRQVRRAG